MFQPVVSTCCFKLLFQPVVSTCCFNLLFQPVVSTCCLNLLSQPVVSTCFFNLVSQNRGRGIDLIKRLVPVLFLSYILFALLLSRRAILRSRPLAARYFRAPAATRHYLPAPRRRPRHVLISGSLYNHHQPVVSFNSAC